MIVSNREHIFGAKCGTVHTDMFKCVVSTAKEGVWQKQSTVVIEGDTVHDPSHCRLSGKILYTDSLSSSERLRFHDVICKALSDFGTEGHLLSTALDAIFEDLAAQGVVADTINMTR